MAILALAPWAGAAIAADQPQYAPPPAWVKPVAIPKGDAGPTGAAIQVLLFDSQSRFGPADEFYSESAVQILSPAGLSLLNGVSPSWKPETETLTFHRLEVRRGDQVIDLLEGGKKVTVLRREKNLELAMLDGDMTASLQPEGLQVGDVIDMAFTLTRKDPVLRGNSEGWTALPRIGVARHVLLRAIWPDSKPIRWRATDGLPKPVVTHTDAGTEFVVDASDFTAPTPPSGAPSRYQDLAELAFSQFHDWADVSTLMAPLYEKAETLGADSLVKLEAQKIGTTAATPRARAEAALRLVQDQIRYAFVGMNLGGFVPADADVTWARRFGDCKGKTVLLIALLHALGIEAEPALVSTAQGDGLDQRLPALLFDHVIVRARIDGKIYWLDGTRSGDRDLDDIATPDFHWALPVREAGGPLERLTPKPLDAPEFESTLHLDATAGLDAPAPAHAEHLFRGDQAVGWNLLLTSQGHEEAQRSLRDYWRGSLPWVDIRTVDFVYDDPHRTMRMSMAGVAAMHWTSFSGVRDFNIGESSLGFDASFKREPGLHDDAPFAVNYPTFEKRTVIIALPGKGAGFGLFNSGEVDQTIAARRYERQARIENGVVSMTAQERSLAPEFPAADAAANAAALRALSDFDVTVRTTQPVTATVEPTPLESLPPPTDASGFSTRASLYLRRRDFPHAIEDLDQAIKLDPTSPRYVYNRGVAHLEALQDDLALTDFNQALHLDPSNELALEARAQLYLFRGDSAEARSDLAAAERLSGADSQMLDREARALERAGLYADALAAYDRAIAKSPSAQVYNDRCWARGESGRDLAVALADCDTSLKLSPNAYATLDTRGFVELRMGRFDDAIQDYDAALEKAPGRPTSLYGRGLAKLRRGARDAGLADLAAARLADPKVGAKFDRLGLKP